MRFRPVHLEAAQGDVPGLLGPVAWRQMSLATAVYANGAQQVEDIDQLSHVPDPGHDGCGPRGGSWAYRSSAPNVCFAGAPISNSRRTNKEPHRCVMPMINS